MDEHAQPTNPVLKDTLAKLEDAEASVWNEVAENLGKVNRQRPEVNVSQIQRVAEDGDNVVVPGKVLGSGRINKDVTVAAFKASSSARKKINENGEFKYIQEMMEENPDGDKVRIVK